MGLAATGCVLVENVAFGSFVDLFIDAGKKLFSSFDVGRCSGNKSLDRLAEFRFDVKVVHLVFTVLFKVFDRCFTLRHLSCSLLGDPVKCESITKRFFYVN